jgi:tRNA A-37 threonylcarbamoyl transferase component Bud32
MNLESIKHDYGINATKVVTLRNNVAIIENAAHEKSIIKCARTTVKGNTLNKHRFLNELRIYQTIQSSSLTYLHAPKLINSSKKHMVLQFVKKNTAQTVTPDEFIDAYLELQTLKVPSRFWFDLKNQIIRGFYYKALAVPLFTLRKYVKTGTVLKIIFLFLKLDVTSTRLKNKYWLHGDLTTDNVYHNYENQHLYFLDFENLVYTRKWPLFEIIQKCLWLKDGGFAFHVDLTYLKHYYAKANNKVRKDLQQLDLRKQIRFSLLLLCINNIAVAKGSIKRNSYIQLLGTILNDKKFLLWYNTDFENLFPVKL